MHDSPRKQRSSMNWTGLPLLRSCSILAVLALILTAYGAQDPDTGPISLETRHARFVIGRDGTLGGLIDLATGTDYLNRPTPVHFMIARRGNVEYPSSRVERNGNEMQVTFGGSGLTATIRAEARDHYITFEVVSVNQQTLDELVLLDLPLTITERVARVQEPRERSETLNVARNDEFGVAVCSLNLIAHSRPLNYEPAAFRSSCYPRFGMQGAKVALLSGPAEKIREYVGQMAIEQGLPHPTLGGEWGKVSQEIRKSYLFVDFTEENVDQAIELAKAGGFGYILNYGGTWASSSGKYEVNLKNFPNGLAGVKAVMDKIHAAGLKGGAHILSGCVDMDNAYVTPIPDPRLAKDDMRILAHEISATDTVIPLTLSPEGLPEEEGMEFPGGKSILIDNEIITYDGMQKQPPYALTGCVRGAFGTRAEKHGEGSRVYHMGQRWGMFVIDGNSSLVEEVAQNVADVINYCGFDQIYFDGLDGVEVNGPFFYYVGKMVRETTRRFNREVIVQGSNLAHINWHDFSRLYTIDFAYFDQKRWVDHHCEARMQNARNNLMPAELGWFGFFLDSPNAESTTPDIVEYVLAKTIGWDVPWSLETQTHTLLNHGRTREILALCKHYEELRLANYFPPAVQEKLRTPHQDFKLVKAADGTWGFRPASYGPPALLGLNGATPTSFDLENRYSAQPFKVRLKARPSPAPFEHTENVVLVDPGRSVAWTESRENDLLNGSITLSREVVRVGESSFKFTARNTSPEVSSWLGQRIMFPQPLNLQQNRALGLWVHGDGSKAVFNIRLRDQRGYYNRDHLVPLDFEGWRYVEIREPSGGETFNYSLPDYDLRSLRSFDYANVVSVTLFLTAVPANSETNFYFSRIEALRQSPSSIDHPSIQVGNRKIMFPVLLENNEYLEYWGEGKAKTYDKNGFLLKEVAPVGGPPGLKAGLNRFEVTVRAADDRRRELRVEVITMGEMIR